MKPRRKMFQEPLTHQRRPQWAAAFAGQGRHRLFAPPAAHPAKRFEIRVDIQHRAKVAHPVTNGEPHAGNEPGANPDPSLSRLRLTMHTKIIQHGHEHLVQAVEVGL